MHVDRVVPLPSLDSGMQHSIVRLHNSRIDSRRLDKSRFFRREPLVIINPDNGAKVLRYAMGTPGGLSVGGSAIALDYDGIDALSVKFKTEVSLEVRRASPWEVYRWFWAYPDLSVRLSIRLGVVGAGLGVLGFMTGFVPLLF
jgi:hypothetical protein